MKPQSLDRLILGHLDIRSIRNKFDGLRFIIDNKTDILLISETILDDAFPTFSIFNRRIWTSYSHDRNSKDGGLLLYIREDIPPKKFSYKTNYDIATLIVEINHKKESGLSMDPTTLKKTSFALP